MGKAPEEVQLSRVDTRELLVCMCSVSAEMTDRIHHTYAYLYLLSGLILSIPFDCFPIVYPRTSDVFCSRFDQQIYDWYSAAINFCC